jgi:pimeloyl-ACP methyl ester carboxylesterase
MSISEALGEERTVELAQGTIRYRERGEGEPVVFVGGLLTNGDLWRKVVPRVAESARCITPDWPLGAHSTPLRPDADLTPGGVARLIADFMAALELENVTLVGNDSGTALGQIVATEHPERLGRLVLTSGDAFGDFPPLAFKSMIGLGYAPPLLWLTDKALRPRAARRAGFRFLARTLTDPAILESYLGHLGDPGIRRDVAKFLRSMRGRYTERAAEKLPGVRLPTLLVWADGAPFFPNEQARKLADLLPDARVELVPDSYAFVSEDQPERTAELIAAFVAERPAGAAAEPG